MKFASNPNLNAVSPPRPEFNTLANVEARPASNVARPSSEGGWYARKRDEVRYPGPNPAELNMNERSVPPPDPTPITNAAGGANAPSAAPPANRRVMLEWSRPLEQPWTPGSTVAGLPGDAGRTAMR